MPNYYYNFNSIQKFVDEKERQSQKVANRQAIPKSVYKVQQKNHLNLGFKESKRNFNEQK